MEGEIIDSIVLKRKLSGLSLGTSRIINGNKYSLSTGYSQGFIIRNRVIQEKCEDLAIKLGIRGPVNIQSRFVKDKLVVFEVHPRLSGTTSIRAETGFNEPDILIRNFLFNEQFKGIDYKVNVAALRAFTNIIVPLSEMESLS
jgi:carbamoyl-phosphate synthase large subunit